MCIERNHAGTLSRSVGQSSARGRRVLCSLVALTALALGPLGGEGQAADGTTQVAPEVLALSELPETQAMRAELSRTMNELKLPNRDPAYYGAYWLVDYEQLYVRASLGAVVGQSRDSGRRLRVELRVGDETLDNSNFSGAGDGLDFGAYSGGLELAPQGDDPSALRRAFWLNSDAAYRSAVELLDDKRAQRSGQVELQTRPPDFSREQLVPTVAVVPKELPALDQLQQLTSDASKLFSNYPALDEGSIAVQAWWVQRTLLNSQGVLSRHSQVLTQIQLQASAQASDGMPLVNSATYFGAPTAAELAAWVHALAQGLTQTAQAELVTDSYGPVLFRGIAAGQIAHDLLAMNLSGTPQGEDTESAFSRRLGKRVLPDDLDAFDDPTLSRYGDVALLGHYAFDDEGVRPRRVQLVERGRLQQLLMSRTPSQKFAVSTGHGRSGLSGWARAMVGNLIIEPRRGEELAKLERKLLTAAREQGAEFGLVVERLQERSFATGGMAPPALESAYKLYLDGRRVPVRGGELSELNVRDLRTLLGTGKQLHAYSFLVPWPSGLPSGSSVVAPDLLFEEVEVTRPKRSYRRPKVLPRP